MRAIYVEPNKAPTVVDIDNELKTLQDMVGGTIQCIYPFPDDVSVVCNDEGKLLGLEFNRFLRDSVTSQPYDTLRGSFLVVGLGGDDFCDLTDEQVKTYTDYYKEPDILDGYEHLLEPYAVITSFSF